MAQMHFYVPDTIEKKVRSKAEENRLPVSRYVARIVTDAVESSSEWPSGYFDETFGTWEGGVLERPPQGDTEERGEL